MARSIEELIAAIDEHRDVLDATAAAADRLGEAPEPLVAAMRELRVPMVKVPAVAGGDNLTLSEQMRYFSALSYHNATAGWTGFNHAGAAGAAASKLGEPGFQEVFGGQCLPLLRGGVGALGPVPAGGGPRCRQRSVEIRQRLSACRLGVADGG